MIVGLSVFIVYMSKLLNAWNARFFNALQDKNAEAFWAELIYWVVLVALFIVAFVYRQWLTQLLTIRWRRWLSEVYFRDWLADRTYYHMELTRPGHRQPRAAHRAGLRHLRQPRRFSISWACCCRSDLDHVRRRAVEPVRQLRACRSSAASSFPAT